MAPGGERLPRDAPRNEPHRPDRHQTGARCVTGSLRSPPGSRILRASLVLPTGLIGAQAASLGHRDERWPGSRHPDRPPSSVVTQSPLWVVMTDPVPPATKRSPTATHNLAEGHEMPLSP